MVLAAPWKFVVVSIHQPRNTCLPQKQANTAKESIYGEVKAKLYVYRFHAETNKKKHIGLDLFELPHFIRKSPAKSMPVE